MNSEAEHEPESRDGQHERWLSAVQLRVSRWDKVQTKNSKLVQVVSADVNISAQFGFN